MSLTGRQSRRVPEQGAPASPTIFDVRPSSVIIEAECLGADLSCESILLVVYEFFSLAIVCWEARVMECTVICLRVGEIEGTKCEQVNKREDK